MEKLIRPLYLSWQNISMYQNQISHSGAALQANIKLLVLMQLEDCGREVLKHAVDYNCRKDFTLLKTATTSSYRPLA